MNAYIDRLTFEQEQVTLYVRGWTKWPIMGSEAKFYVDGISLQGPIPGSEEVVRVVSSPGTTTESMPTTGGSGAWIPIAGLAAVLGFAGWEIRRRLWPR
jgi:hypothetical protein